MSEINDLPYQSISASPESLQVSLRRLSTAQFKSGYPLKIRSIFTP
jgi:hypothetical protein